MQDISLLSPKVILKYYVIFSAIPACSTSALAADNLQIFHLQGIIIADQSTRVDADQDDEPENYQSSSDNNKTNKSSATDKRLKDNETGSRAIQEEDETIVVTGSHIRGAVAAGANVEIFGRDDIDRSGYATINDFIRTVPQNFSGGGGSEQTARGQLTGSNRFEGTAVDIRGLGADSTLVLINGRRLPSSGFEGNFVDISTIPQSAIERVEILTDGASALYGSDAVGGVANFILRKDYSGAETRLRYGSVTDGDTEEYRFAQSFGHNWNGGHFLVSYEFYKRDSLRFRNRDFASTMDQRGRGGSDFRQPYGSPGNIISPFTFQPEYAIPAGQDGRSLSVDDLIEGQINYQDLPPDASLLPKQRRHSGYLTLEQAVGSTLSVFAEGYYTERRFKNLVESPNVFGVITAENPFFVDPYGMGFIMVQTNLLADTGLLENSGKVKNRGLTGGFRADIAELRWQTYVNHGTEKSRNTSPTMNWDEFDRALIDTDPNTALNLLADGKINNPETISKILAENSYDSKSRILTVNSVIDGPLFSIGDRDVAIAAGVDYRSEKLRSALNISYRESQSGEALSRSVYAAFAELYAPLIETESDTALIRSLDFSLAGRLDKYSDSGLTGNPKAGIRLSPSRGLFINATYGTSFRAANLSELTTALNSTDITSINDPSSSTGSSRTLILFGNNPETDPEKATTWTVGFYLEPVIIPGLTIKMNYASTNFTDRIVSITDGAEGMLAEEHLYPGLIVRNPGAGLLNELCSAPSFTGDITQCTPELVDVIVDQRLRNVARTKVRSIDGAISYGHTINQLTLSGGISATYIIDHTFQQTSNSPSRDRVDTIDNPVDFRSRANLSVSSSGISANIFMNYLDSYENTRSPVQKSVSSYTTFDFTLGLTLGRSLKPDPEGPFRLSFNALNVFDKDPPFVDDIFGYDAGNVSPMGRFLSLDLTIEW